jgi:hypothetical protein
VFIADLRVVVEVNPRTLAAGRTAFRVLALALVGDEADRETL